MKYFKINYPTELNMIGGSFPQLQKAIDPVNANDLAYLWNHPFGISCSTAVLPELIMHQKKN